MNELKAKLQDHKKIKIHGMRFIIRKINPFLDFDTQNMPQIFSDFISSRKIDISSLDPIQQFEKFKKDMYSIIESGVVDPVIVPVGKGEEKGRENGITVDDLFRDSEIATKLYSEILQHSLNKFRGIKGLFFSIKTRLSIFMQSLKNMEKNQLKSYSQKVDIV